MSGCPEQAAAFNTESWFFQENCEDLFGEVLLARERSPKSG
ncbi:hypothetical protein [Coleofasciculus sp. H7-2]